jgi:hypothetical protein
MWILLVPPVLLVGLTLWGAIIEEEWVAFFGIIGILVSLYVMARYRQSLLIEGRKLLRWMKNM